MALGAIIRKDFSQLVFVFLSFALMVLVSYLLVSRIVEKEIYSNIEETLRTAEAMIRSDFREAEVALLGAELFVERELEEEDSLERIRQYLARKTAILIPDDSRVPGLTGMYAYVRGQAVFGFDWDPPAGWEPEKRVWYDAAQKARGAVAFTDPYTDAYTGKTVISLAKILHGKNGEDAGVIVLDMNFALISDYMLSLQYAGGGYGMLIDQHYRFIAHPNRGYLTRSMDEVTPGHAAIAAEFRARGGSVASGRMPNSQGVQVVLVFRRLYNNWLAGIATPVTSYYRDVYVMALVLSFLGFVFMTVLSAFLIRLSVLKARSDEESRDKSSFLARMSHEIRTPMNSIIGMAELIQRKAVATEIEEYSAIINQSGATLLAIINDILDFSRIESGRLQIEKRHYHLASVINDMINVIRPRAAEKSLDFFVDVDGSIPARLAGDDVRIRQILVNLLSNAVKYTQRGFVSLAIKIERQNNHLLKLILTVEDSGIGIKNEDRGRLFSEFARVDIKVNQGIEGTGLGLVITQALCRAMDGDVTVDSEYGVGSTFRAVVIQEYEDETPLANVTDTEHKKILFYDWRSHYIKSLTTVFGSLGLHADCSGDFQNFLAALEQGEYDYAFISSRYAAECMFALEKRNTPLQLVLMVELGEVSVSREVRSIMMPVYSVSVANVLNDCVDEGTMNRNVAFRARFTAPGARVLIVDDISTNLRVAKELMAPYNMIIHTCVSGAEAIEMVKANRYDLVFMDHMMPGMDGLEATSFIRSLDAGDGYCRDLPIIALTANAVSGQQEMFLENGINDFLAKPIDIQKLDDILEKWLPRSRRVDAARPVEEARPEKTETVSIPGVDIEAGIRNVGGRTEGYFDILLDFCRDAESRAGKITAALDAGDLKLYVTLVHALKGAARSIGAVETGDAAAWLEARADREDPGLVRNKTAELLEQLAVLTGNIRRAAARRGAANGGREDISALHLLELRAALADMNIETVNWILLEYSALPPDGETKKMAVELEQHILMFEYDKAMEKIEQFLNASQGGSV
ncbi:MAG: response regulator [Spirochaetaceae bacterium]|jgi:signal transduction histidine kinase/CheY-like chemotaxis protein|nr:response regulator [Spirochaetaceae bacterium]